MTPTLETEPLDRTEPARALRASNDRFARAFSIAPCPMTITRLADGRFVDVNAAFLEMTGFRHEEVVGRSAVELGIWTAEERERFAAPLREGRATRDVAMHYRRRNGEPLDLRISCEPIDVDGEACILSAFRDETQATRTLEALRRSEEAAAARAEELCVLIEATPALVWIAHDPGCQRITGSRAAHASLRMSPDANLSKSHDPEGTLSHFRVLQDGRELSPDELPLQRASRGEVVRDFEEEIVFDDGERLQLLGNAVPLRDSKGEVRGAVAAFVDVSRLNTALEALRQADRRKDEFLALLGHELRSPLAAIQSAAFLLEGSPPPELLPRLSGVLRRQSSQLVRLVDDLLDVSRITHGKIHLHRARVGLREIVDRAVEGSRHLVESAGHAIDVSVQDAALDGDLVRLSQVVCNLLNNAAKYTPPRGRIRVIAGPWGEDEVSIAVEDNGVGLHPDSIERIFELFEQSRDARTRSQGGLGVGLALARELVRLHGGTLTAASEGLDRGSRFEVRLPRLR